MSRKISDLSPDEVDTDAINAYHLGGNLFSVSLQLTDRHNEIARSYLFKISFDGRSIRSETIFELPSQILSHVSRSPDEHVVLDLGATTHLFRGKSHTTWETPFDDFVDKIWQHEGGELYLLGDAGICCIAEGQSWRPIKRGTRSNLRTIHGQPGGDVYVAGFDGVLLRLAGGKWKQIPLNFNVPINAIHVASDGRVKIGGDDGNCFEYFEDRVDEIQAPETDFASIYEFKGKTYWGDDGHGLLVQDGLKLVPFRALEVGNFMHASHELLVVVGWKEVFLFDGDEWRGFEFEYDGELHCRIVDMTRRYL
jgi:hypothetical protein